MESLKFDAAGLIPAVAQDRTTGAVRMVAWMNAAALERSQETGYATFYSRSRGCLWMKGESSGNRLKIQSIVVDCDSDTLLLLVDPEGPSCHTGEVSCFFSALPAESNASAHTSSEPFLFQLEATLRAREQSTTEKSYTRSLLAAGPGRVGEKLCEEAAELAQALAGESDERVAEEAADLLYHLLVGLRVRNLELRQVIEVLQRRAGVSGHAEKASRAKGPPQTE